MLRFLRHYSRKDIQKAIAEQLKDKELGVRYKETFGKRPDTIQFETDVFEFARKGATSFHTSEETWIDPMNLATGLTKKQLDDLRKGWDLILDIDCAYWDYSKLTAYLLIEALKFHNVKNISTKFSVVGDTPVFCEIKSVRQILPIQEAISKFKEGNNVKILSLKKNLSIGFSKIYNSLEHKTDLFEIYHSNNNRPVLLSPDHSVYIFSENDILAKKTKNLKKGDYVVSFKGSKLNFSKSLEVPVNYKLRGLPFKEDIKITKDLMRLIGYYLAEGHLLEKYRNEIGFSFNIKEKEYIGDVVNLISKLNGTDAYFNRYQDYLKDKELGKNHKFLVKKYGSWNLGKYKSYNPSIKQATARIINKEEVNTTQILFCSSKWNRFFKTYCGNGSHNKKVPDFVFKLPKEYFMELLKGYLRGDGYKGEYHIKAKSVSKKMIVNLVWLCKLHGLSCGYSEEQNKEHKLPQGTLFKGGYVYCIRIPKSEFQNDSEFFRKSSKCGSKPDDYLMPLFPLRKVYARCRPKSFIEHRFEHAMLKKGAVNRDLIKKIINWFVNYKSKPFDKESKKILKFYNTMLESNLSFLRIRKIKKLYGKKKVYDVSVRGSENFFGGNLPILLHNSGNKGFHIGIPFEAFPDEVNGKKTKDLYPESLRVIAAYLQDMIKPMLAQKILEKESIRQIISKTGKTDQELMEDGQFNPFSVIDIDTILISSRHLYRSAYSMHEKSELVSIPIDPNKILSFNKEDAKPEKVTVNMKFMDREKIKDTEARELIIQAFDWHSKQTIKRNLAEKEKGENKPQEYDKLTIAINEDKFPPCIKKVLEGKMEDGKKRGLFLLLRFLGNVGWSPEAIDKKIREWNATHPAPLNEGYMISQLMWHKRQKELILPPNCINASYYKDLQLCPENCVCARYKNPVNYTKTQYKISNIKEKVKKSSSSSSQASQ